MDIHTPELISIQFVYTDPVYIPVEILIVFNYFRLYGMMIEKKRMTSFDESKWFAFV